MVECHKVAQPIRHGEDPLPDRHSGRHLVHQMGHGFCSSCGGRRVADTAAHLVDRVLPKVCSSGSGCSGSPSPCAPSWSAPGDLASAVLSVLPVKRSIIASCSRRSNSQRRPTAHISPDTSPAGRMAVPSLDAWGLRPEGLGATVSRGCDWPFGTPRGFPQLHYRQSTFFFMGLLHSRCIGN